MGPNTLLLCFIATTAHAAPLYLKCEGKGYDIRCPSEAEFVTQSIKVDGTNVWFEGGDPVPIYLDDGDVWTFGSPGVMGRIWHGTLNRITGRIEVMDLPKSLAGAVSPGRPIEACRTHLDIYPADCPG
jgi:hypothetical protein